MFIIVLIFKYIKLNILLNKLSLHILWSKKDLTNIKQIWQMSLSISISANHKLVLYISNVTETLIITFKIIIRVI